MNHYVIGIDIGGTNIKIGLVDKKGLVRARGHLSTKDFIHSKTKLIEAIVLGCQDILKKYGIKKSQVSGIGIGLPGLVNTKKSLVYSLTNIPGWKNVPLKKIIEKKIKIPTFIDNDVNVMTLAEWKYGAGRGMKNMVCITIGTGLGGGLVINNQLYRGEGFAAGELGHIPINEKGQKCNCGGWGCLETYAGNRYLNVRAKNIFHKKITLEEITCKASLGEKKAIVFWKEVAEHIGNGLTGVVNVLNPSCIVIGGGIAKAHQHMFQTIRLTIKKRAMHVQGKMVRIVKSRLGSDAGIIGTRVLVKEMLGKNG
jgi:glucokinase